jgi:hypothetical protein
MARRQFGVLMAGMVAGGCGMIGGASRAPERKGQFRYQPADVQRMAVLVPNLGKFRSHENVIETAFVEALLAKSYDVVTRSTLNQVATELMRRKDRGFDPSTAAEVGKLAGASHIVVAQMPNFSEKRDPEVRAIVIRCSITAQVIEVASGRVLGAVTEEETFYDPSRVGGGAGAVRKVAQRCAGWLP